MLSRQEYHKEINEIALDLWNKALEDANDDKDEAQDLVHEWIHELVDGHHWVIYNYYHNLILHHSSNDEAYLDVYDDASLGQLVKDKGVDGLHTTMAYFAMSQDIQDSIYEVLAA